MIDKNNESSTTPDGAPPAPKAPQSLPPVPPTGYEMVTREVIVAQQVFDAYEGDMYADAVEAVEEDERRVATAEQRRVKPRRVGLPLTLFIVTCLSTFWAGATFWSPGSYLGDADLARMAVLANWGQGLTYMACLLAILGAHEMGHFLATVRYRIPASFPMFLPLPITPIGTMGAVIGMDGLRANRRELFDIGIAGPLAGLVVAIPILGIGIAQLDLTQQGSKALQLDIPFIMHKMLQWIHPDTYHSGMDRIGQLNPFLMAGWVGLLVTGLNMLPLSQLDGGHVLYTLFGRPQAHKIARTILFVLIALIVINFDFAAIWMPMVILITLMGVDHPPTADDSVELGPVRTALGYCALMIPILCFPPHGFYIPGM